MAIKCGYCCVRSPTLDGRFRFVVQLDRVANAEDHKEGEEDLAHVREDGEARLVELIGLLAAAGIFAALVDPADAVEAEGNADERLQLPVLRTAVPPL